jgi:hypothetical protein
MVLIREKFYTLIKRLWISTMWSASEMKKNDLLKYNFN